MIVDNVSRLNTGAGVEVALAVLGFPGALVSHNTIEGNSGTGVLTSRGSLILDNVIVNNSGAGIFHTQIAAQGLQPQEIGYGRNTISGNGTGTVVTTFQLPPFGPFVSTNLGGNTHNIDQ